MSRYVLFHGSGPGSFALVPADAIGNQIKELKLPDGIVYMNTFTKVRHRTKLAKLLYKILKTEIQRTKDGLVADKYNTLNIRYDDAIVNSCNGLFVNSFEKFYCLLRKMVLHFKNCVFVSYK